MMMFDRTQPNLRKQLAKPVEPICQSKARIGGAILGSILERGESKDTLVLTLNQRRILSIAPETL